MCLVVQVFCVFLTAHDDIMHVAFRFMLPIGVDFQRLCKEVENTFPHGNVLDEIILAGVGNAINELSNFLTQIIGDRRFARVFGLCLSRWLRRGLSANSRRAASVI